MNWSYEIDHVNTMKIQASIFVTFVGTDPWFHFYTYSDEVFDTVF